MKVALTVNTYNEAGHTSANCTAHLHKIKINANNRYDFMRSIIIMGEISSGQLKREKIQSLK